MATKKIPKLFLFICVILILSVNALSMNGLGTPEDPFQITKCTELQDIQNNLTADYILINNIDCSDTVNWNDGKGFKPIGSYENPFKGNLNGHNKTVKNLFSNASIDRFTGIFASIESNKLENFILENITMIGIDNVGLLSGSVAKSAIINNTKIKGKVFGNKNIGGITGRLAYDSIIENSNLEINLTGNSEISGIASYPGFNNVIKNIKLKTIIKGQKNIFPIGSLHYNSKALNIVVQGNFYTNQSNILLNSVTSSSIKNSLVIVENFSNNVEIEFKNKQNIINFFWNNNSHVNYINKNGEKNSFETSTSYFYSKENEPMASWDFENVWCERENKLPTLRGFGDCKEEQTPSGYKDDKGIIHCETLPVGDTFEIEGITYTVVNESMLRSMNTETDDFTTVCTSHVTDMNSLFLFKHSFNQRIGVWDISNVENMDQMFFFANVFNGDINNWNTSKVKSIERMFTGAYSFNQDLSNWDVSNVENMKQLFNLARSFNGNISNWNTSKIKSMYRVFSGAYKFNQDISNWDVSNVESMKEMFSVASNFNKNISKWNVSNVENMDYMLPFTKINYNLSGWCVKKILEEPEQFSNGTSLKDDQLPIWGTCPTPEPECPVEDGQIITESITFPPNVVCNLPNGLIIGEDSINVDCQGALLDGTGFNNTVGLFGIYGDHVTITNCTIKGSLLGNYTHINKSKLIPGNGSVKCKNCNYTNVEINNSGNPYEGWNFTVNGTKLKIDPLPGKPGQGNKLPPVNISDNFPMPENFEIDLNCQGSMINGSKIKGSAGIYVNTEKYDVTIRNCVVQNYDYNVYLNRYNGNKFINNTLRYPTTMNLQISNTNNALFVENNVGAEKENVYMGYFMKGSNNIIVNNTFTAYLNTWDRYDNIYCLDNKSNKYTNDRTGPTCEDCIDSDNDGICDFDDECPSQNISNMPENTTCASYTFENGCHVESFKEYGFIVNSTTCSHLDETCKLFTPVNNICDGRGNIEFGTCKEWLNNDNYSKEIECGEDFCDENYFLNIWSPNGYDTCVEGELNKYTCYIESSEYNEEICGCEDTDNDGVCDSEDQCNDETPENLPEDTECTTYSFDNITGCHVEEFREYGFFVSNKDCSYLDTTCKLYDDSENICDGLGGIKEGTCESWQNNDLYKVPVDCPDDKCVKKDLFNYVNDGFNTCINGEISNYECTYEIIKKAPQCINNNVTKPKLKVYTLDDSSEKWTRVTMYVENKGKTPVEDFVAYYYVRADEDKEVVIGDWDSPQADLDLEDLGNGNYRVKFDFEGTTLNKGEKAPKWHGIVFGVAYKNQYDDWNSKNDYSFKNHNNKFLPNNKVVVYDKEGNLIFGKEPKLVVSPTAIVKDESISVEKGQEVTLDASSSFDKDGEIVSYVWKVKKKIIANTSISNVKLKQGSHIVTLIVTDDDGEKSKATVKVTVGKDDFTVTPNPIKDDEKVEIKFDRSSKYDGKNVKIIIQKKWDKQVINVPSTSKEYTFDKWGLNHWAAPITIKLEVDNKITKEIPIEFNN